MATGSFIQVTSGAGPKMATGPTYTENANVVQDQKILFGEPYSASYTVGPIAGALSAATANSHLLEIMAGSSLNVRIDRIRMWQLGLATTTAFSAVAFIRLSSAGTGGGVLTPAPLLAADGAAGATCMSLPTVKGGEVAAGLIRQPVVYFTQTLPTSQSGEIALMFDETFDARRQEALLIPAGTSNGLAIKLISAVAAATVICEIDFREMGY
jgi:hypothetical protein